MEPDDKPYLTRVWPYLLAVVIMSTLSIIAGRSCAPQIPVERNGRFQALPDENSQTWSSSGLITFDKALFCVFGRYLFVRFDQQRIIITIAGLQLLNDPST